MPIQKSSTFQTFNIIKFKGSPKNATLIDGSTVEKQDSIFIPQLGAFIPCAPYDNHFIYLVPVKIVGPSLMCTCGSPAVWVGSDVYEAMASPAGALLVCLHHMNYTKHLDGSE